MEVPVALVGLEVTKARVKGPGEVATGARRQRKAATGAKRSGKAATARVGEPASLSSLLLPAFLLSSTFSASR